MDSILPTIIGQTVRLIMLPKKHKTFCLLYYIIQIKANISWASKTEACEYVKNRLHLAVKHFAAGMSYSARAQQEGNESCCQSQ